MWKCRCECGNFRIVNGANLRKLLAKSCGCKTVSATLTHDLTKTREYKTLMGMIGRCNNPDNPRYPYYGGRGIKVCDRWLSSPEAFVEDMGLKPTPFHSIERNDNEKGYSPDNCRWATKKEQARNRRTSVFHTAHGKSMTLPEWSEYLGVKLVTLQKRMQAGFTPEKVFSAENYRSKPRSQASSLPA